MGASRLKTFISVTLPLSVPGIANAFLLVFVQSLADFGNPMTIGGNYSTVARDLLTGRRKLQLAGRGRLGDGAADGDDHRLYSAKFLGRQKSYVTITGKPTGQRRMIESGAIKHGLFTFCMIMSFVVIAFYALVPIGSFIKLWGINNSLTLDHYKYVFSIGQKAIKDTLTLAIVATPIAGLLGMIIAFLIVRKRFFGKRALEVISMLSIAVPGTVIGIGYILAFNKAPLALTGTGIIIVAAFVVRSMPVGIRSGVAALQQIDPSIEEAATNLGASGSKVFTSVVLPLIKSAFSAVS